MFAIGVDLWAAREVLVEDREGRRGSLHAAVAGDRDGGKEGELWRYWWNELLTADRRGR